MRVISGKAKGVVLKTPDGLNTRPTTDRVKEALFSIIQFDLPTSRVLDLFAGSGQLGIEALSREAKFAVFVDERDDACKLVRENLKRTKMEAYGKVIRSDYMAYLKRCTEKYDIIFLDPPYASGLYEDVLSAIKENKLLEKGALIVAECDINHSFDALGFNVIKEKTYGKVKLYVLEEPEHEKDSSVSR